MSGCFSRVSGANSAIIGIGPMNTLPLDKQIQVISALTEGVSIRATERLTGVHRDTVMRLGVRVGEACAALHDQTMRGLNIGRIELDEIWGFVGKKQRKLTEMDGDDKSDQYTFTALDGTTKAIVSYTTGKRTLENTMAFAADLRERIVNKPIINSDGFVAYPAAIEAAFGADCSYGQIVKHYVGSSAQDTTHRYSPGAVVAVTKNVVSGKPGRISTSYVERSNLTLRMQSRRFTRLTNGHSKKFDNHKAAVSLFVAHYNFCRVHETLRVTPAMSLGLTNHIWSVAELINYQPENAPVMESRKYGKFTVIDGGVS